MGRMMLVSLLVLRTPEDTVVQAEHIESRHGGNTCHDPSHHRTVLEAGCDNLILRAEAREEGNTCDGETTDEEGDMRNRHILTETTHQRHLIAVDSVDNTSSTEEQASLEHGVGEEVEHTSHITQLSMIIHQCAMMTWQRYTQCHHHEGDLRDG